MTAIKLISRALNNYQSDSPTDIPVLPASDIRSGICAVTGEEKVETLPRRQIFGRSFMDGEILAAPDSDRVSVDACRALKFKWERMSSWRVTPTEFQKLDRLGVRDAVINAGGRKSASPWAGYATTSYKKHGALRAPVNVGFQAVWLFESRLVDCTDYPRLIRWWIRLNEALRAGFSRPVLESCVCPVYVMRKVGLSEWLSFEAWARTRRNSALYAFLCYLLPSQKELQAERKINEEKNQGKPDSGKEKKISKNSGQVQLQRTLF